MHEQGDVTVAPALRDQTLVAGALLRVWAGDQVAGAAFLLTPDLVATARGVVAEVADGPGDRVRLDFPLLRDDQDEPVRVTARVHQWPDERDTVLLRIEGAVPPAARMPPLRGAPEPAHGAFSVLAFPPSLSDGVWTTGSLAPGAAGETQLISAAGEQVLDAGCSGAPVWEEGTGAVIGMAVGSDDRPARLVPIADVLGYDPDRLPSPYPGLRAFDEEHADTFFGRDDDIEKLLGLVGRLPVVAVAGPSGAGKSSLVRAGLVPRLRAAGTDVVVLRAEPGVLGAVPAPGERDLVVVLDQFEELAALDPAAAREVLEGLVHRTGDRARLRAVLTLRWSSLDTMITPELAETLTAGTVLVGPLDRSGLEDAIVRPAFRPPGLAFEPGLVETILDDAGAEPGRLPLVESLLATLWERRDGGFLTLDGYRAAGGVAGALARHADTVVAGLPPGSGDALRRLLTALARPGGDGRFVRRAVPLHQLPAGQRALVPALTSGRLLTVGRSVAHGDVVELAHQALLQHWPRLADRLAADREFLTWRETVAAQRERWEADGRADTALLRGRALAAAAEWLPERADDLPGADRDYLRRSTARQRREVRGWRVVAAVVAVLAVGAAVLAAVTVRSADQIATQLAVANADALGREAQARHAGDPAAAAQLALSAWRSDPGNPQARTALLQSFLAMRGVERELAGLTTAPITDLTVAGDTALLIAAPHPTVVTGLAGPAPQRRELTNVPFDRQYALAPDGLRLAVQNTERTAIELHDLRGGAPVRLPGDAGSEAGLPRFSPDGARLAWAEMGADGSARLRLYDLGTDATVPHRVAGLPADTQLISFTTDPDRILLRRGSSSREDSRLVLLSLRDGTEVAAFAGSGYVVRGGAALLTCEPGPAAGEPGTAVVAAFDGSPPLRIRLLHTCGPFSRTALPADADALVEPYVDQRAARVTDLATGAAFDVTLPVDLPAESLRVLGSTRVFGVAGGAGPLMALGTSLLWLRREPLPPPPPGPGERVVAVGPDFHLMAGTDGRYRTVDAGGARQVGEARVVPDRAAREFVLGDRLWRARTGPTGWDLTSFDLPALRPSTTITLPGRDGGPPVGDRGNPPDLTLRADPDDPRRLVALADGVLSSWDTGTGQALGPRVPLGATGLQAGFHRSFPRLEPRPGHPGQVVVLGSEDVQIWDVRSGQQVTAIPGRAALEEVAANRPLAVDAAGNRIAVLTRDRTVQVWDIDTARPVGAPIPAADTETLVGFDADGYLVTTRQDNTRTLLALLDLTTGAEAATVDLRESLRSHTLHGLSDDGRALRMADLFDRWAFELPITAQSWRDGLCAAVARPLTPAEERLLPPGVPADPPCG